MKRKWKWSVFCAYDFERDFSFKDFRFIEKKNFCKHVVEKKFVASCNFGAWHHPKTVFFFFSFNGRNIKWSFFIGRIHFDQIVWLLEETYETKKDDIKVATKFEEKDFQL